MAHPSERTLAVALTTALLALLALGCQGTRTTPSPPPPALTPTTLGSTARAATFGDLILLSQPSADDLCDAVQGGVRAVLDLRKAEEERGFDEAALLEGLGVPHAVVPFAKAEELTDRVLDEALSALRSLPRPLLVHCSSANRVGAVWIAHRVLEDQLHVEDAVLEAKQVGLRSLELETRVRDYLSTRAAPKTLAPRPNPPRDGHP